MIVPMKKVAILVQSKDSTDAVHALRSLGVVHVEHQRLPQGKAVGFIVDDIALVDTALSVLSQDEFLTKSDLQKSEKPDDWRFTAKHIIDLRNRLNQLKDYGFALSSRINQWENWGDFDPDAIKTFKNKNIFIKLYQIPIREIQNVPPNVIVRKIATVSGMVNCLAISRQEIKISFKEVALPKTGLATMRARFSENSKTIELIKKDIVKNAIYRAALVRIKHLLEEELEFHHALQGMGQAGEVMYLRGYIPFDAQGPLQEAARREKWGIMVTDPGEDDRVPTLIRNPRWVSIIKPVFKLIEVVPGYCELDISLWFLIFFSIFFGMLIGDAGIGVIFLILTFLAQKRWSKKVHNKSAFFLLYISSACTLIWGVLTGTFFGQEWLSQLVKPLIPAMREDKNVQALCFFLGSLHLSIAHGWRALLKMPSLSALAETGWILILWGAFFMARMLVLRDAFPFFGKWFIIAGAILVVLFTRPSKNMLKGIGSGLGNLLLNLVNSFTDVVSYIRLFAVGLATVAVADSFNRMAMDIGFNNIFAVLTTALILLVGHMLNVMLAPMSVLVHGVRLNVLEFCNHANVKWGGFAYNPLRKKNA